ncbi:uncharacterized protein Gasu_45980 [Galdieria sulphuraria]|uniref:Uncharacterized protein n=1 Tax=Galdieria sulphuraria TaxID=130081 RepID=M2XWF1_GALSU|nr:uncharacterized protein Gasu_45980 [Galdieria sulphuraria]EME27938.1 hypothetical protein Gasu_45980 [Galdieria sulphuraria]|eukprot:XP_005704458.1 hypothetical protein Gasu_45980 [Galdieria sulphuraria]
MLVTTTGVRFVGQSLRSSWRIKSFQTEELRYNSHKLFNHYNYLFWSPSIQSIPCSVNQVPSQLRIIPQGTIPKYSCCSFQFSSFCTGKNEGVEKIKSSSKNSGEGFPPSRAREVDSSVTKLNYNSQERTGLIFPGLPVGLVSGFLGSMAGIGGAVFAIPLLCRFGGFRQRIAAGSTLFAVFGTAASSAYAFHQAGQVDHFTALNLSLVGLLAAPVGALFSNSVSSGILRRSLGIFLMFISPLMFIRLFLQSTSSTSEIVPHLEENIDENNSESNLVPTRFVTTTEDYVAVSMNGWNDVIHPWKHFSKERLTFLSVTGATVGFLSGFLGVSGGTLFTPVISFIGCSDGSRDFHTILGTSFMAMTLPAVTGGIAYALKGSVRYSLVPSLCLGTVAGAAVGSRVALQLPDSFLKVGMAVVFSLVGYRIYRVPIHSRQNLRK